jgi:DNA-binding CsgD family transcriptional regulator
MKIEEFKKDLLGRYSITYPFNLILRVYKNNLGELDILDICPRGVYKAIDTLTEKEKCVVDLLYNGKYTHEKTAEILGVSTGTITSKNSTIIGKMGSSSRKSMYLYSHIENVLIKNDKLLHDVSFLRQGLKDVKRSVNKHISNILSVEDLDDAE